MLGAPEAGDTKREKVDSTQKAVTLMGVLGEAATSGEAEVASSSVEDRYEGMMESMGTSISTGMNIAVGYDLQAKDARSVAEPLMEAKSKGKVAAELEKYEDGKVAIESLSEAARKELSEGKNSTELMDEAEKITSAALEEKRKQQEALDFDKNLANARSAYVEALTSRKGVLPAERARRKEEVARLEGAYNQAFVQRISEIMDLNPSHRKAPYVVDVMQNLKEEVTFENLAGNHLHVLADSIAREQIAKAREIESRSSIGAKKVLGAFKKSRALRVVVGGAIWGASIAAANKGMLPAPLEGAGDLFEKVLPLVAGYVTGREVAAGVEDGVTGFKNRRELKNDLRALSENSHLGEAALRTIYSDIEYEDVSDRQVGKSEEETRRAFGAIDSQFAELEQSGARGGKPYSAEQIMPIVSELYLERKDQIDGIVESSDPQEAFKKLCAEVIAKDSRELTKKVYLDKKKTAIVRALSVASSVFVSQFIGVASDLQGASVKPMSWAEKV